MNVSWQVLSPPARKILFGELRPGDWCMPLEDERGVKVAQDPVLKLHVDQDPVLKLHVMAGPTNAAGINGFVKTIAPDVEVVPLTAQLTFTKENP